jgi:selenophosphate synthetase-related protein
MNVADLVASLRESRGFRHKTDIVDVVGSLARHLPGGTQDLAQAVALGDDCAAIADGRRFRERDAVVRRLQQRDGQRQ